MLSPQHTRLSQHNLMKSVIDFCNLCQLTNIIGRCLLSHLCRCIKNDSFWPLSYPSDYREYKPFSCPRRISHYSRTLPRTRQRLQECEPTPPTDESITYDVTDPIFKAYDCNTICLAPLFPPTTIAYNPLYSLTTDVSFTAHIDIYRPNTT